MRSISKRLRTVAGLAAVTAVAMAALAVPAMAQQRINLGHLMDNSGATSDGSSSTLPSDEVCSKLASTENGASPRLSLAIGIWCFSA